jgi:acyl-CoA synthetase (AMP-forming)/AMP-acid ligase II
MIESLAGDLPPRIHTEWVMMTSGTTGVPKMVIHDLATLTTALRVPSPADGADVWGTFYDIRRYGGFRFICARSAAVRRLSFPAPANRSPIISRGLAAMA